MERAVLALEDGTVFEGKSFGAPAERSGEVVFNTALTGYQEVFTDPSYSGQIVILTNPQIGNYGTSAEDNEAAKPYIEGLAVREFSPLASNWRSDSEAGEFLARHGIPIISGLDTRALVRHLRSRGVMRGVLSAVEFDAAKLVEKARGIPTMVGLDLASRVTTPERYTWTKPVESCSPSELVAARARAALPRGGLRFRHQAQHPAAAGAVGLPRDGGARAHFRRRRAGARAGRHIPLERSRRSRAAAPAGGQHPQADRPASRSSASAWATSCSASRWAAARTS